MKLTYQNVHALFNLGCPNTPQRISLGLEYPLKSGWIRKLIGREIEQAEYDRLMALKGRRPKGVQASEWAKGSIAPAEKPPRNDAKALRSKCREQFSRLIECLRADEILAAQDHAQAIVEMLIADAQPAARSK